MKLNYVIGKILCKSPVSPIEKNDMKLNNIKPRTTKKVGKDAFETFKLTKKSFILFKYQQKLTKSEWENRKLITLKEKKSLLSHNMYNEKITKTW